MDGHALISEYWRASEAQDWEALRNLVSTDVVHREPQNRETVHGRDRYLTFSQAYPIRHHLTIERIIAEDDAGASWTTFDEGDVTIAGLCFFRFREGHITEIDDFYTDIYKPPPGNPPFVTDF